MLPALIPVVLLALSPMGWAAIPENTSTMNPPPSPPSVLPLLHSSCGGGPLLSPEKRGLPERINGEDVPALYVFVSLDLPPITLQALMEQTTKAGGVLVVRGLVQGSFRETAQRIQELGVTIHIDPPLFEHFQVKSVPTFILTDKLSREEATGSVPHDRIAGNIFLMHACTLFAEKGDLASQAQVFLRRLKESS